MKKAHGEMPYIYGLTYIDWCFFNLAQGFQHQNALYNWIN